MTFTLPYPPSTNRLWKNFRGMMVMSSEARAYKANAAEIAARSGVKLIPCSDVAVTLIIYRPRRSGDLDNRIKAVLDCIKGIAWTDDKQVKRLAAERFEDPAKPRVEVTVTALDSQLY